jgi:hypothetical protein
MGVSEDEASWVVTTYLARGQTHRLPAAAVPNSATTWRFDQLSQPSD